ncbi:MAG TPA: hypothetical protein P5275_09440 [Saprospiraceae bacterium]|nr:hypothetical protein [Saprospiraceae bacterium]HPG08602.1 hypothetical protein [Saprospiraceae bacterium]HRV85073.1 hypothetical protein [Saprospiraceae bacterium]
MNSIGDFTLVACLFISPLLQLFRRNSHRFCAIPGCSWMAHRTSNDYGNVDARPLI